VGRQPLASATTTSGASVTPAARSSVWVALTIGSIGSIGSRCPKSDEAIVTSAATTIWASLVAACAL